mgnify:CR=1 FL=1
MEKFSNLALVEEQQQDPQDLMSIKELCLKHDYDYDYLYKWAIVKGVINVYLRGTWKLSESEVLEFSRNMAEKRLSKIRKNSIGGDE